MLGEAIAGRIEPQVAAEDLIETPLRLDRDHAAARTDGLGEEDRMRADIRADIDDEHPRLDDLREERDLALGEFAAEIEGSADKEIGRQLHHRTVPALLNAQRWIFEDQAIARTCRLAHRRSVPPVAFSAAAISFWLKASIASSVSVASTGCSTTVIASDFLPGSTPLPR